jgi:hypothetical protein
LTRQLAKEDSVQKRLAGAFDLTSVELLMSQLIIASPVVAEMMLESGERMKGARRLTNL